MNCGRRFDHASEQPSTTSGPQRTVLPLFYIPCGCSPPQPDVVCAAEKDKTQVQNSPSWAKPFLTRRCSPSRSVTVPIDSYSNTPKSTYGSQPSFPPMTSPSPCRRPIQANQTPSDMGMGVKEAFPYKAPLSACLFNRPATNG